MVTAQLCVTLVIVAKNVTGCSIFVWFNNFDWTLSFYWSYTLLLKLPVLMHSNKDKPYYGNNSFLGRNLWFRGCSNCTTMYF